MLTVRLSGVEHCFYDRAARPVVVNRMTSHDVSGVKRHACLFRRPTRLERTLELLAVQSAAHDINILFDAVGQGATGRRITTLRTGEVVDE